MYSENHSQVYWLDHLLGGECCNLATDDTDSWETELTPELVFEPILEWKGLNRSGVLRWLFWLASLSTLVCDPRIIRLRKWRQRWTSVWAYSLPPVATRKSSTVYSVIADIGDSTILSNIGFVLLEGCSPWPLSTWCLTWTCGLSINLSVSNILSTLWTRLRHRLQFPIRSVTKCAKRNTPSSYGFWKILLAWMELGRLFSQCQLPLD